jgi:uncharacterized membrane protein
MLPPLAAACNLGAICLATPFRLRNSPSVAFALVAAALALLTMAARSPGRSPAERRAAGGIHSVMRYPRHAAAALTVIALAVHGGAMWFLVLTIVGAAAALWLMIPVEERLLERKYGDDFLAWRDATGAIWPRFAGYTPPKVNKTVRQALGEQLAPMTVVTLCFMVTDVARSLRVHFIVGDFLTLVPLLALLLAVAAARLTSRGASL